MKEWIKSFWVEVANNWPLHPTMYEAQMYIDRVNQMHQAEDIKNEKIDLLYKFKKLESQGIRTTMNYNMNSHLEDMRNEYIKVLKNTEIQTF